MFRNLDELKAEIHDFEWFHLGELRKLALEFGPALDRVGAPLLTVTIEVACETPSATSVLALVLEGVRQLSVPELGGRVVDLSEVEFVSMGDRGLEDIRYMLNDPGSGLSCYFAEGEVRVLSRED